jgi:hypothetical protein
MLSIIEDVYRILVTQKNNITIGDSEDDSFTRENIFEYIKNAESIINAYCGKFYKIPFRGRILLKEKTPLITMSLDSQMKSGKQIQITIRGIAGDLSVNNTITIIGTDFEDNVLEEILTFTKTGSQVTENYFKTVNVNGIIVGANILLITNPKILIISSDILNYICQRLTCFSIYCDVFSNNSPDELPEAVLNWKNDAIDLLKKIQNKEIILNEQIISDNAASDRPVYNIPIKHFLCRGIAGLERLEGGTIQDCDNNVKQSTDEE